MDDERLESLLPENRIKQLNQWSEGIKIDPTKSAQKYYNSLDELIRRANMHLSQNQLEDAYMLYMRYSIIIAEKILTHPGYRSLPREVKKKGRDNLADVIPKAEELKKKLLANYAEEFSQELERRRLSEELLQKEREEEELRKRKSSAANYNNQIDFGQGVRKSNVDKNVVKPVEYLPDDFLVYGSPDCNISDAVQVNNSSTKRPGIDRSTKPAPLTSYNGTKLRPVVVPSRVLDTFLRLAETNTNKNVETCGVLTGRLQSNRYVITHLLVPKQRGTADSCTTENEEDLFHYQSENNLITIGWIHTHPSQTSFLSSVDLHTHYSYQLMLSEAIAIVCAPKHSQTGIYHLTPEYGLNFLGNCQQKGFHPHPSEPPLFQTAEHCQMDASVELIMVDMR